MQRTLIRAAAAALLCAGALAACGGGGSTSGVTPTVHSTASPSPIPTATPTPPQTSTGTATVTSAATAAPIPAAGGYTGTLNLPASNASGSVTLALTTSTVAPPNLAPMAARRSSAAHREALPAGSSVLLYETLTSPVTITFNATPEIDLTLPSGVSTSGVQFFIAAYEPTSQQWQEPAAGPAAVSGQNLTFASEPVAFTMQAGVTYTIALYSAPVVQPTATPTTQPTATPPPSSAITLTPSSLSLAVNQIGTFTASEANYTGAFTAKASSGSCEVWAPNGSYVNGVPSAPDGAFDVDLADTNPCSITVSDGNSNTASITVTASVSAMTISPASLTLNGTGTANAQSFTISGGLAPFTTDGYDSTVISVTPDQLDQSIFHVTPLKAGQTTITIHDSTGHTTTLSVGVTTVSGVIQ